MTAQGIEYLDTIDIDIIESILNRNWKFVQKAISRFSSLSNPSFESKCSMDCCQRHNFLHFLLRYNPPLSIIRQFVKKFPASVYDIDCVGHFPLQTALIHGTTPETVEYLIATNEMAATNIDMEGKTSLHLAFDAYEVMGETFNPMTFKILKCFPEVIHVLCLVDPSYILKEDNNDMIVLEYAIEKEVDYSIIRRLQKISMDVMKRRQNLRSEDRNRKYTKTIEEPKPQINFPRRFVSNTSIKTAKVIGGRSA